MKPLIQRIPTPLGWKLWRAETAALLILTGTAAWAHPGRTDARGCHTCRTNCAKWGLKTGEYHCHNGGTSSVRPKLPPPSRTPSSRKAPAPPVVSARSASSFVRLSVTVIQVLDGDTLVANVGGRHRQLHLYDVDAPEMAQPFGEKAEKYVSAYLANESIDIVVVGDRKSGGLWVRAFTGEEDVAKLLLGVGLAWCRPEAADDTLKRREAVARRAGIGLWGQEQPEAPWNWRLTHGDP